MTLSMTAGKGKVILSYPVSWFRQNNELSFKHRFSQSW